MIYALGNPGGAVRQYVLLPDADDISRQLKPGEIAVSISAIPVADQIVSPDGKSVTDAPIDLERAKRTRWIEARRYRDSRMSGVCSTPSGALQIDDASMVKLNGAVNRALIAERNATSFSIDWTMADDTIVCLDANALIAAAAVVVDHMTACQTAGSAIRAAIYAAPDAGTVAAIDIADGYPK